MNADRHLLIRQTEAEDRFYGAWQRGRLDSAWLITGPAGVGKGALAIKMASFLLARDHDASEGLDVAADNPVHARIAAGTEPGLRIVRLERDDTTGGRRGQILVDDIRAMQEHFRLAAIGGNPRIAIIDSADDLNRNAANALLKDLEEPPGNAYYFLTSGTPLRLLPTIRSRCRILPCLSHTDAEIAAALAALPGIEAGQRIGLGILAEGSIGMALRLHENDGYAIYEQILAMMTACQRPERHILQLVDRCVAEPAPETLETVQTLCHVLVARLARLAATGMPAHEVVAGEAAILASFATGARAAAGWSALYSELVTIMETARLGQLGVFEKITLMGDRITSTARALVR